MDCAIEPPWYWSLSLGISTHTSHVSSLPCPPLPPEYIWVWRHDAQQPMSLHYGLWSQHACHLGAPRLDYSPSRHQIFLFFPISALDLAKVVKVPNSHPSTPCHLLMYDFSRAVLPHWPGPECTTSHAASCSTVSLRIHASMWPYFHSRFWMAHPHPHALCLLRILFPSYSHPFLTHSTVAFLVWLITWKPKFEKSFPASHCFLGSR